MSRWLLILILITSGIVTYDYHFNPTGWYDPALFFLPLTMLLTVLMLRRLPAETPNLSHTVTWQPFTRWQIIVATMGVICFAVVALAHSSNSSVFKFLLGMHHAHQLTLFLIGISLIIWGMTGGLRLPESWRQFRMWTHESDAKWLLLFILLGLFVRTLALESAIHYYVDEINFSSAVTRLRIQPTIPIMSNMGSATSFTWIYTYFQYYYTELFGATLANLRGMSVIIGTLTIPAVYLLGRWAFSRRIGLLASFLLAFYLPHIHYSRLGMNNIADPLLGVMTIALLWRGLKTGSRSTFAWAGVFLGMTSYFYEGGRLLYPALIIGWIVIYNLIQTGTISKRGLGVFFVTTALIASGFYLSLAVSDLQTVAPRLQHQRVKEAFWARLLTSTDAFQQVLLYFDDRLNPPYLHIMSQPDGSGFYYSDEVGLVFPHMLPFLLIGLGVALFHWQRLGLIFPLWLLLTVFGNSLIVRNDWTPRFVVLFPALVLLIALGLDSVYRVLIWGWLKHAVAQRIFRRTMMALLLLMGVLQIGYYFGVMLPDYNIAVRFEYDDQDVGFRVQTLSPDTQVYVISPDNVDSLDVDEVQDYERHQIRVNLRDARLFDFTTLDHTPSVPHAFFIAPNDIDTLNQLKQIFGNRLIGPQWSPYNVPRSRQYVMYQVYGT
jgi:hypothetical protein